MARAFVKFVEVTPSTRRVLTRKWSVLSLTGAALGLIRWKASWRKYTFEPCAETVYDAVCLIQIANWCITQTDRQFKIADMRSRAEKDRLDSLARQADRKAPR